MHCAAPTGRQPDCLYTFMYETLQHPSTCREQLWVWQYTTVVHAGCGLAAWALVQAHERRRAASCSPYYVCMHKDLGSAWTVWPTLCPGGCGNATIIHNCRRLRTLLLIILGVGFTAPVRSTQVSLFSTAS